MKNKIVVAFTIVIMILCGLLPVMSAKVVDFWADNTIHYEDMKTLQLFRELNDTQKMYLLAQGTRGSISKERARLKQESMYDVVEKAIMPYFEGGYIEGELSEFTLESTPVLFYSSTETNLSAIFWEVVLKADNAYGQSIYLYLDDSTGKILTMSYECKEMIFDVKMWKRFISEIFLVYQSNMDWYEAQEGAYGEEYQEYEGRREISYIRGDIIYGELEIIFTISELGFRIGVRN